MGLRPWKGQGCHSALCRWPLLIGEWGGWGAGAATHLPSKVRCPGARLCPRGGGGAPSSTAQVSSRAPCQPSQECLRCWPCPRPVLRPARVCSPGVTARSSDLGCKRTSAGKRLVTIVSKMRGKATRCSKQMFFQSTFSVFLRSVFPREIPRLFD